MIKKSIPELGNINKLGFIVIQEVVKCPHDIMLADIPSQIEYSFFFFSQS